MWLEIVGEAKARKMWMWTMAGVDPWPKRCFSRADRLALLQRLMALCSFYENEHDVNLEHKPLYEKKQKNRMSLRDVFLASKKKIEDMLPGGSGS